ncbi:MAG TPA: hypothetical protein VJ600_05360 [Holophagaceae bacterium]|nr:hypothetical protein [Holophagaceae bacterium]
MTKKFWLSTVVLFVLSMGLDFLIHGWHLHGAYQALPAIYRSDADGQKYMGWMLLAHAFIAYAFVYIYLKGREERPWLAQGLRFGFLVAVLTQIPTYLIYYAVEPLPGTLVAHQIFLGTVACVLEGVVVAGMNK